jgi:DNA-binding GntR family transcriptional regulator
MSLQLQRARMLLLPEEGRPAGALAEHHAILDAIRASDPEAARTAMSLHLRELIKRIIPLEHLHPDYFRPAKERESR